MKKSFTLIELITTISITMILILVSFPLISKPSRKENQIQTVNKAIVFIQRAETLAQNPENKDAKSYLVSPDNNQLAIFRQSVDSTDIVPDEKLIGYEVMTFSGKIEYECYDGKFIGQNTSFVKLKKDGIQMQIQTDSSGNLTGQII